MPVFHRATLAVHVTVELFGIALQIGDNNALVGTDAVVFYLGDNPSARAPASGLVGDILEVLDREDVLLELFKPVPTVLHSLDFDLAVSNQYLIAAVTDDVLNLVPLAPTQQQRRLETGVAAEHDVHSGPVGSMSCDQQ